MATPEPSVIGRYEVVSRLGQGGMGSLYLAKDPKIGRLVAIKLVRQEFDSPDARQRFAREAQSAGTLRHPNIVTIFDVDEHEGFPFIAMEYIDGETLGEIVKRKALLPVTKRIQWVEDLCSGLAYAHRQGVIHRDIKPANLMVDTEGALKILDFGLARRDASKFTQSHVIIGTPNYMSPEQIRGTHLDTRSDIFSVGALMYEVLAYKEAFPGAVHQTMHKILHEEPEPLENFVPDLDPQVGKILARAIVKDRDGRYPDLAAMKADLAEVRARMETAAVDANTLLLGQEARFNVPATAPMTSRPGTAPISSLGSKRVQTNRQSLQRRRSEQITVLLDEARRMFESGELDKARDKCDEALMFDPDHPGGLQLMDDIAVETDRQQVARIIAEARAELQKGQLDRAEALVADARQMSPESADVTQLQEAIDTTRREIERTRQIQETMRRARARFAEGGYDAAIRAAGEVLAIDPENAAANDLQARARESIESHNNRAERDAAAQSAVAAARKLFESGDAAGAIAQLEAFTPKTRSRQRISGHAEGRAFDSYSSANAAESVALPRSGPSVEGETAHTLRGARGEAPNLPARSYFLIAAAVLIVAILGGAAYYFTRPLELSPSSQALNQSLATVDGARNASAPAAVAVTPPLAPVAAPTALTDKPVQSPDDKDIVAAFGFLSTNQIPRAQALLSAIRKRNPKHEQLGTLGTAIETRLAEVKKQEEAIAEIAKANAALEEEKKRSAAAAEVRENSANAADLKVLPGGGNAAPSEPPTPALLGAVERPGIEKAITLWGAAFAKLDVTALSKVRTLTPDELKRWQNTFRNLGKYKMNVRLLGMPEVIDNEARVLVEEISEYAGKGNNQPTMTNQPFRTTYRLRKIGGEWKLIVPSTPMPASSQ